MRLKLSKCSISQSYNIIRFYMHDRFRGCGLGMVNVIRTPQLLIRTVRDFPLAKGVRIIEVGLYCYLTQNKLHKCAFISAQNLKTYIKVCSEFHSRDCPKRCIQSSCLQITFMFGDHIAPQYAQIFTLKTEVRLHRHIEYHYFDTK